MSRISVFAALAVVACGLSLSQAYAGGHAASCDSCNTCDTCDECCDKPGLLKRLFAKKHCGDACDTCETCEAAPAPACDACDECDPCKGGLLGRLFKKKSCGCEIEAAPCCEAAPAPVCDTCNECDPCARASSRACSPSTSLVIAKLKPLPAVRPLRLRLAMLATNAIPVPRASSRACSRSTRTVVARPAIAVAANPLSDPSSRSSEIRKAVLEPGSWTAFFVDSALRFPASFQF